MPTFVTTTLWMPLKWKKKESGGESGFELVSLAKVVNPGQCLYEAHTA